MALSAAVRESAEELLLLHDEGLRRLQYAARMQKLTLRLQNIQEDPAGHVCEKPKRTRRAKPHTKPGDGITAAEREDLALQRLAGFQDCSLPALLREYCAATCSAGRLDIRVLAARLHIKQARDVLIFQAEVSRAAAALGLAARKEVNLFAAFTKAAKDRARTL